MVNVKLFLSAALLVADITALPAETGVVYPRKEDFDCESSHHAWESSYWEARTPYTTVLRTRVWEGVTGTDTNVPITTLCDGRPRALESYKYFITATTTTYDPPRTVTQFSSYTEPTPACTVAETACTYFLHSWSSAWDAWVSSDAPSPSLPHCTTIYNPPSETPTPNPPCNQDAKRCVILARGNKKLYYWPVTTADGDLCLQNGTTITPEPTIPGTPNTAVVDGYTFTSPTNYVWLDDAVAVHSTNYKETRTCGPSVHTSVLIPLTETLSSIGAEWSPTSLNFAHFNQPIPVDAWDQSWGCRRGQCGPRPHEDGEPFVIEGEGEMMPLVPVPPEVVALEDEWVSVGCTSPAHSSSWSLTPVPLATPPPRPF